jgi:osmotically-inducible protein OsmY
MHYSEEKLMSKSPRNWDRLVQSAARPLLALTLGVSILTNMSGCALLLVGGAVGGAMSASDRRTFGAQTEDTSIEFKGSSRISTVFGDTVHIDVNSYNRKVLLTGEVKDEATKAKVEAEIAALENVHSVVNEIQVALFLSSFSARSSDALLSSKVRAKLVGTKDIYSSSFKIVTEAGVVYLMGRVSHREGDTAATSVQEVSGVQKIIKVFEYIDESEIKKYEAKPAEPSTTSN